LFGYGYPLKTQVIGYDRWYVYQEALSNLKVVDTTVMAGVICYNTTFQDNIRMFEWSAYSEKNTFVFAREEWKYEMKYVMLNIASLILGIVFAVLPFAIPSTRMHYTILGVCMSVLQCGMLLFDTAISSEYVGSCELRMQWMFGEDACTIVLLNMLERLSAGAFAAVFCQGLLWATNPFIYNTGEMPTKYYEVCGVLGIVYSFLLSIISISSYHACSANYGLHTADYVLPIALGIILYFFIITKAEDASKCAICELEGCTDLGLFLWKVPEESTKRQAGIKIFDHFRYRLPGQKGLELNMNTSQPKLYQGKTFALQGEDSKAATFLQWWSSRQGMK